MANVENLVKEIRILREAIETHRSQKADDRCIEDDDRLYAALRDGIACDRRVGSKEEMLNNCKRFIENRCEGGGWKTYAQIEQELNRYKQALQRIEKWFDEFPPSGKFWEDGKPMSYGAAWGSNGERDYMREIARRALEGK